MINWIQAEWANYDADSINKYYSIIRLRIKKYYVVWKVSWDLEFKQYRLYKPYFKMYIYKNYMNFCKIRKTSWTFKRNFFSVLYLTWLLLFKVIIRNHVSCMFSFIITNSSEVKNVLEIYILFFWLQKKIYLLLPRL